MGITAEKVAAQWKISREDQDEFSFRSHQRALAAQKAGDFKDEIAPIEVVEHLPDLAAGSVRLQTRTVSPDEGPRADTSTEALPKLNPVFAATDTPTPSTTPHTPA